MIGPSPVPRKAAIGTETSAAVGTRGNYRREAFTQGGDSYEGDAALGHLGAYGVNAPSWGEKAEPAWRAIAERPWMAGGFVWTGFDIEANPRR
jgi:beta-galactosidase